MLYKNILLGTVLYNSVHQNTTANLNYLLNSHKIISVSQMQLHNSDAVMIP